MSLWIYEDHNKYIADISLSLEKAKYDLAVAKMELYKVENDLLATDVQIDKISENLRILKQNAIIVSIVEFKRSQIAADALKSQHDLLLQLSKTASANVKIIENKVSQLSKELDSLVNNILELKRET